MHTIQAQFSVNDVTGQISLPAATQRETINDEFILESLVIPSGTLVPLDFGVITTPYRICIKLIGGDPITISVDGGTTPTFQLLKVGEFVVFQINDLFVPAISFSAGGISSNIIVTIEPK